MVCYDLLSLFIVTLFTWQAKKNNTQQDMEKNRQSNISSFFYWVWQNIDTFVEKMSFNNIWSITYLK